MKHPVIDIPREELNDFRRNIFRGNYDDAVQAIENRKLNVNSIFEEKKQDTLLVTCMRGLKYGENIRLAEYLLEKGADPNKKDSSELNAFHYAVLSGNVELCELFLKYNVEVNAQDDDGYSAFFHFLRECYSKLSWKGIPLKKQCLAVIEEMLKQGADPDLKSRYDTCPREYLCPEIESVRRLFNKYDAMDIKKTVPQKQESPVPDMEYTDVAKFIWKEYVPKRGQSKTVQGEMLRAVEKLRDEAQRNGNINFNDNHKRLAGYVQDTLSASGLFDNETIKQIKADIKKISAKTRPYLEDDIYDRLCDRICEYHLHHGEPVPRDIDPELDI